ncbi:hypothetical protein D3C86_1302320 [compost metagenome]
MPRSSRPWAGRLNEMLHDYPRRPPSMSLQRPQGMLAVENVYAGAMDLKQAWDLLQFQGPIYQASVHEKQAGEENRAIGTAGPLPQINASAYDNKVNGSQSQNGIDRDLHYDSKGANVRLRQPLFNKQKMAEYRARAVSSS